MSCLPPNKIPLVFNSVQIWYETGDDSFYGRSQYSNYNDELHAETDDAGATRDNSTLTEMHIDIKPVAESCRCFSFKQKQTVKHLLF